MLFNKSSKNIPYQNHHKHSYYTNIMISDSTVSYEDYAKRAVELGHGILSSMEHGWQGRYFEVYEIAKKYNLKFIFGTEAYWVMDRTKKDSTNNHICIYAKNENGRQAINYILSEANLTGFYRVPRLDLSLLLSLPKNDVLITTACVGFYKYGIDESTAVIKQLSKYFEENIYLEVQCHNFDMQNVINTTLLALKLPIIFGADSHYIYPEQEQDRTNYLKAKGIIYQDEENCMLDYPDSETVIKKFEQQGILNSSQIEEALNNTNVFLKFDDIKFNKDIKLPSIYKNKSQTEKNRIFSELIYRQWDKYKKNINKSRHPYYEKEIKKEIDIVCNTNMSDYFLLDYEVVEHAKANGGRITSTGRGSSVGFIINTLLGLSKVDRIAAKVQMYPERFMSETRILKTKSLPDLDLNLGNPEVFLDSQTKIIGENSSYQMAAWGTFKTKSAFKLYAKSQNLDFTTANEITSKIDVFEKEYQNAEDDIKETLNVYDFVDKKYHNYLDESSKYKNIISDKKPHPCASLIYDGDIRKEWGLIKIKNTICTVIDGQIAENYKFLKNDLLKVDVVNIIALIYEKIGIEQHTVNELIEITKNDKKTWDIYSKGLTVCINQCEKEATKQKIMSYKPQNISELTAFIAAIRPSFKSMFETFKNRENFNYDIPEFDNLIQTEEIKDSFILYQEQIMSTLNYSGISNSETYDIIKSIAKKKYEKVYKWKKIFLKGFAKKTNKEAAKKVWTIIEDSAKYGFNASHAYCVACDSLYGAYLKANYTLEFYEVCLNYYAEKSEKNKLIEIKNEVSDFKITINPIRFRADNRNFTLNRNNNSINESMVSIKDLTRHNSKELYKIKDNNYNDFIELLYAIKTETNIQQNQLDILIKLNYFYEYGLVPEILQQLSIFELLWNKNGKQFKKQLRKAKVEELGLNIPVVERNSYACIKTYKNINAVNIIRETLMLMKPPPEQNIIDILKTEYELLGYIRCKTNLKKDRRKLFILNIDFGSNENINPKVLAYCIGTGKTALLKIKRNLAVFKKYDVINVLKMEQKPRYVYIGTENNKPQFKISETEKDWWIEKWQ